MTSSNGNIFRVTGLLCGEFTGPRWILRTKASDAELWCFLWSAPEINSWVNNPEAGDLRRHRAHCDVSVMSPDVWMLYRNTQHQPVWPISAHTHIYIYIYIIGLSNRLSPTWHQINMFYIPPSIFYTWELNISWHNFISARKLRNENIMITPKRQTT